MSSFNIAQTFYLDKDKVKGCSEAGLVGVDLYFRGKPRSSGNKSGILNPGVEVSVVATINGIPNISEASTIRPTEPTEHGARFTPRYEIARKEWTDIVASRDASIPTYFEFQNPIFVPTDYEYAILIKFDGDEDFVLWYTKIGDPLVGNTQQISTGPSGKYIGNYFTFVSSTSTNLDAGTTQGISYSNNALDANTSGNSAVINSATPSVAPDYNPDPEYLASNWRAVSGVDLKFGVYVARYAHNGFPVMANTDILNNPALNGNIPKGIDNTPIVVSNNLVTMIAPSITMEWITFDLVRSTVNGIQEGEILYQDQVRYPGGAITPLTISVSNTDSNVVANGAYVMPGGNTFNNSNGVHNFVKNSQQPPLIFIDHGSGVVDLRSVVEVYSNTAFRLNAPASVSNSSAHLFMAPVGTLFNTGTIIRNNIMYSDLREIMTLIHSTANTTCRFANHTILDLTLPAASVGHGYNNSDYIVIRGYEYVANELLGGYPCYANIVTNPSGNVIALHVANAGCGFVNTSWIAGANIEILNANGAASNGAGLTFTPVIGANIRSLFNHTTNYANCEVVNLESHRLKPEITVNNPLGTSFTIAQRNMYMARSSSNTFLGRTVVINENPATIPVKIFKAQDLVVSDMESVIPSRSNQFVIGYANGVIPDSSVYGNYYSNASLYLFSAASNNDYQSLFIEPEIINSHYSKYLVNNDYTNENTNYGNAIAKHVMTKINFQADRRAEDVLVWLTAWRPYGTDLKVFARVHNSLDPEAFDDKDWTLLECTDGNTVFSSRTDTSDFIELEYSLPYSPNSAYTCNGSANIVNVTTQTINGDGTNWLTELANGDLIKIYSPLFPNNYIVSVVNVVSTSNLITISKPVSNNGLIGSGFKIDKLSHKKQAFKNIQNKNVVRYFNEDMVEFDTYDTIQIKVVLLSNNEYIVPKFDDVRGVGVTA